MGQDGTGQKRCRLTDTRLGNSPAAFPPDSPLTHTNRYGSVNRKALDQYTSFTEQREELGLRKAELDRSETKIRELIHALDMRKDEAIERTFKGVAKHFGDVFAELVPGGLGGRGQGGGGAGGSEGMCVGEMVSGGLRAGGGEGGRARPVVPVSHSLAICP